MAWAFPPHRFNIEDASGATYADCHLITEDEESVTFECVAHSSRTLMRTQLSKDAIRSISWPASAAPTDPDRFLRDLH